jgi:hypothetical protein
MNRRSERLSMKDPISPHYSYIGYLDYVDEDETDFTSESEPDSGSGIDASSSDNEELLEDFLHMYKTTKARQRSRISKSGAIQSQVEADVRKVQEDQVSMAKEKTGMVKEREAMDKEKTEMNKEKIKLFDE